MTAVYKKELKSYVNGMTGAIFAGFLLLMAGIFTTVYNLRGQLPNYESTLSGVSFIFLLIVPVLTMRSVAEERHSRTDQLLYALPMPIYSVVLAKYLAMLTVLAVPCAVMGLTPLILSAFGKISFASAYGALLCFFLLGAALIAIGLFISSLTESQVIAAVVTLGVLLLLYFMPGLAGLIPMTAIASAIGLAVLAILFGVVVRIMTKNTVAAIAVAGVLIGAVAAVWIIKPSLLEGLLPNAMNAVALFDRISPFQRGVFDLTAIVFYLSVSVLFVFLTVQSMEKKRWN